MRAQTIVIGLIQAALLMACEHPRNIPKAPRDRSDAGSYIKSSKPVRLGAMDQPAVSQQEASAAAPATDPWFRAIPFDPASRLIVRTGQASIEVDSLEPSMAELRRIVQRVGGFVADASVQS